MKRWRVPVAQSATSSARCALFLVPALAMVVGAQAASAHTWYVSATAPAGGDGSSGRPFSSLALVQQASGPGDTILVEPSPAGTPLDGGIVLKPGQRLIGQGPPVLRFGPPLIAGGPPVVGSSGLASLPQIANTTNVANSGDAVELADDTDVENLVITSAYRGAIYGHDVVRATVRGTTYPASTALAQPDSSSSPSISSFMPQGSPPMSPAASPPAGPGSCSIPRA